MNSTITPPGAIPTDINGMIADVKSPFIDLGRRGLNPFRMASV